MLLQMAPQMCVLHQQQQAPPLRNHNKRNSDPKSRRQTARSWCPLQASHALLIALLVSTCFLVVFSPIADAAVLPGYRQPDFSGRRRLQADAPTHQPASVVGPVGGRPATYLRCSGFSPAKRSCVAYNIYYHIPRQVFVAFGYSNAGNDGKGSHYISSPEEDYTMMLYNITLAPQTAAPDAQTPMLKQAGLNVFWRFTNGGAGYSIGHALVHELIPMYQTLRVLLHDHVPLAFNLVTTAGGPGRVFDHICPATQGRHVDWAALCAKAKDAGSEWIWLEAATLGDNGHAALAQNIHYQRHPDPNMFNSLSWLRLRSWMMHSVGLHPTAEPAQPPLVLLNDKVMPDGSLERRRRINNTEEVVKWLHDEFPGVQVQRAQFMKMSWKEQLELLSRASVFITTEGSSGFRMAFLPPGASTIVLGHPDNLTAGAEALGSFHLFHDVDKYFPLIYTGFAKYLVDINHTDEYVLVEHPPTDPNARKHSLHDAHIIVRKDRLVPLVREALRQAALHLSTFGMVQNWQHESL